MAVTFVRGKARGAFSAIVRQLPTEWQPKVMSLLESVVFRDELAEYIGGSGDLIDHGDLDGLTDDDHTQYHNDARALTWLGTTDITDHGTYDHTSLTSVGSNTHAQLDTHLAHNTGHPNSVVNAAEPADGTIDDEEGAFWFSDTGSETYDFESDPTSQYPSGWSFLYESIPGGDAYVEDDSGNNVWKFQPNGAAHLACINDDLGSLSDSVTTGKLNRASATSIARIWVRHNGGTNSTRSGYLVSVTATDILIQEILNGAVVQTIDSASKTFSGSTWYNFRVEAVGETIRAWAGTGAWPDTWDVSGTDDTYVSGYSVFESAYSSWYDDISVTTTGGLFLKYQDDNSVITNFQFAEEGSIAAVDDCPVYVLINSTANAEGDMHLSGAGWAVSKALIKQIKIETSSTDWDLWILQNDNGYSTDDAAVPAIQLMDGGNGDEVVNIDHPYQDEDASNEVHLYLIDNGGSATFDVCVRGYQMK